jgi:alkylation response protein AidB-like acyl-CoA dehydrogenase
MVGFNFSESPERQLLRESVHAVAASFGHEYYVEKATSGGKSDELWKALATQGFVGVNLPEEYGGGGMGLAELAVVAEECAAAGVPLLLFLVSPAICGEILSRFATPEQCAQWLPPLANGEAKMAFAITEPDAGSNSHRISTTAVPSEGGYRINGTKYYISGVDEAAQILVVTRTGLDEATGRATLSLFVVDSDAPGLEVVPLPVEIRAPEKQFTLFFDDVAVDPSRCIGGEGAGLRTLFFGLNPERVVSAAVLNGVSRYALDKAARYANERQVWGVGLGTPPGRAHPLAEAAIAVELARLMCDKAAWLFDEGQDAAEASNMAKFAAADAAGIALDRAIETHGGNGMATEYGLATLWGIVRLLKVAPVSREMLLNFVAQRTLGLPRSY